MFSSLIELKLRDVPLHAALRNHLAIATAVFEALNHMTDSIDTLAYLMRKADASMRLGNDQSISSRVRV